MGFAVAQPILRAPLVGDFVIAAAEEFDKADAVTERIGHLRYPAPAMRPNLALNGGACINRPIDRSDNIGNHKVEMDRGPVPAVAAHIIRFCRWLCSLRLAQ